MLPLINTIGDSLRYKQQEWIVLFGFLRGAFGKYLAWSFISVTDLQTLSCLESF